MDLLKTPYLRGFQAISQQNAFLPKSPKGNITMSQGTDVYSLKGKVLYSLRFAERALRAMVVSCRTLLKSSIYAG